jgi:hypothetical protein
MVQPSNMTMNQQPNASSYSPPRYQEMAYSIRTRVGPLLSAHERNILGISNELRQAKELMWNDLNLHGTGGGLELERYMNVRLQMRAAYLWAENQHMMSLPDIARSVSVPKAYLLVWITRYGQL